MKIDLPLRWKVAIITALAAGITSALNIPESYGLVSQILGALL